MSHNGFLLGWYWMILFAVADVDETYMSHNVFFG